MKEPEYTPMFNTADWVIDKPHPIAVAFGNAFAEEQPGVEQHSEEAKPVKHKTFMKHLKAKIIDPKIIDLMDWANDRQQGITRPRPKLTNN